LLAGPEDLPICSERRPDPQQRETQGPRDHPAGAQERAADRKRAGCGRFIVPADREPGKTIERAGFQEASLASSRPDVERLAEKIADTFDIDLFCGLFMGDTNDGTYPFTEVALLLLGPPAHIELQLDIYCTD